MGGVERVLELLGLDPGLGGVIAVGFHLEQVEGRRIPPHAVLHGHPTPWGWQPGLLDSGGQLVASLDILPVEAQALLAQRLDLGGCTLVASCSEAPWAHLADRVAFLVTRSSPSIDPSSRPMPLSTAIAQIASLATVWGVQGHRAEEFCLRAALAIARAAGRRRLTEGDVAEAVALVLAPRATRTPAEEAQPPGERSQASALTQADAPVIDLIPPPLPAPPPQIRPSLHGAPVRSVPGRRRQGSLDLCRTVLAALPWQRMRAASPPPLSVRPDDLRWRLHKPRQGRLIIFLVDSSGSMGARRLGQAKGAVLRLLQQAYRRREQVALIAAGGTHPRLLLPPARAVEQAHKRMLRLPAGGATPLAGSLLMAYRLASAVHQREGRPTLLLALTDGRANQPLPGGSPATVRDELQRCARLLRQPYLEALVLGEPGPEVRELSRWLGAPLRPPYALRQCPKRSRSGRSRDPSR